jgi:plasmid stabilization system protein ParE
MSTPQRRLEWSERARSQLLEIADYYTAHASRRAAESVLRQIEVKAQELAQFPFSGAPVEGLDSTYRRARAGAYTLLYRVLTEGAVVRIFAVRHGRRRPLSAEEIAALEVSLD